jgi:tetratricopeptide (TPR) repeat protein
MITFVGGKLMFRKYFSHSIAALALLLVTAFAASAQTGEFRGIVKISLPDGTMAPGADAVIDVYRTDISGKYNTKANKKGEFVFAGLPLLGTYTVAASLPGAQPTFLTGLRAGQGIIYDLTLSPGDGKRLTEEEIKAMAKAGASGKPGMPTGESAADKAKRAEIEAKNAEIVEKNKKAEASNTIVARTFKAGNDALLAGSEASRAGNRDESIKKFGEAIAQYDEGLAADAEQPAILTNKALAMKARGVDRYNLAISMKDDPAHPEESSKTRTAAMDAAKSDFKGAADATGKALELLKTQAAGTEAGAQARFDANKLSALNVHAESMRLFVTKADGSQAEAGLAAYQAYIAAEPDATKKAKAQMDAAQMLLDAGAGDKAFTEFKKILEQKPDDPDANLGAGLALYSVGDKAKYQEAANYLQHFVDTAPDTHKSKADIKLVLTELKNTENVVPEKTTPRRRRPGI